jgi:tryptophan-rich sensory protein
MTSLDIPLPDRRRLSVPRQILGLLGWLAITAVAAGLGGAASIRASSFYGQLAQPSWAPPAAWFGPVWTALYLLMALAAWWVWRAAGWQGARQALALYLAQLALNALWSWLFFAWHQGALAFVDVLALLAMVAATLIAFWRVRPAAGLLLVPYLLWVGFASALNFTVWQLNPGVL